MALFLDKDKIYVENVLFSLGETKNNPAFDDYYIWSSEELIQQYCDKILLDDLFETVKQATTYLSCCLCGISSRSRSRGREERRHSLRSFMALRLRRP